VSVRFFQGYPWRFVVLNLSDWAALTFLDRFATGRAAQFTLNAPAQASGQVASDNPEVNIAHDDGLPFLEEGVRCLIGLRREGGSPPWVVRFAGLLLQVSDEAQSDNAVTSFTAFDPWQFLYARPVRKADGTLPNEGGLKWKSVDPAVAAATLLARTIDEDGPTFIDAGPDYGGTEFWDGSIATLSDTDLNFETATSVGEAWEQLTRTGLLDIRLKPIYDPVNRPGYLAELSIYAQRGSNKPGAIFAWDRPPHSLIGISRLKDGTKRANAIQPYAGDMQTPGTEQTDSGSISTYGKYWAPFVWSGQKYEAAVNALAAEQVLLRKRGQTTVTISPAPERAPIPFLEYDLGDRVPVYAGKRFRRTLSGYQRVYGIPVTIGDDSVELVESLIVSADGV
jgi:hypothetical protein